MALSSTPYKIVFDISDIERNVYAQEKLTVARHPSETETRLLARILAYALFYHEQLQFGRGLSDADEAALWQIDYTNAIEHWVDVGQPDVERVQKASRRAPRYSLIVYGNARMWKSKTLPELATLTNVHVYELPEQELAEIAGLLERNMQLSITISDGVLYLSFAEHSFTLAITELL